MRYEVMRQIEKQLAFDEERLRGLVVEEFPVGCSVRIKAGRGYTFGTVVEHAESSEKCRQVRCDNTQARSYPYPKWHDYRNLERVP